MGLKGARNKVLKTSEPEEEGVKEKEEEEEAAEAALPFSLNSTISSIALYVRSTSNKLNFLYGRHT